MTQLLHWDNVKFSIGHKKLDEQHRTIIGLINQLSVDYHSGFSPDLYIFTMKELKNYIDWHLHYEEKIINIIDFPDAKNHAKSHASFIQKVEELTVGIDKIPPTLKEDVIEFLNDWFRNHILIEDMKLKPYLENLAD